MKIFLINSTILMPSILLLFLGVDLLWIIFFVFLCSAYWFFTQNLAINFRSVIAEDVDNFLGKNDVPNKLKQLVYFSFESSLHHSAPYFIIYYFLFKKKNNTPNLDLPELKKQYDNQDYCNEAFSLIRRLGFVNMKLNPIMYLVCSIVIAVSVIFAIMRLKPSRDKNEKINKSQATENESNVISKRKVRFQNAVIKAI